MFGSDSHPVSSPARRSALRDGERWNSACHRCETVSFPSDGKRSSFYQDRLETNEEETDQNGRNRFFRTQYQAPSGTVPNSLHAWVVGMNRTLTLKGCRMLSQLPLSANATAAANILIADAERSVH